MQILIGIFNFSTLASFIIAKNSRPEHLRNFNRDPNHILSLLKRTDPYKICPTCELVQEVNTKHCAVCNLCIVDYHSHSCIVDNCITRHNRMYYIVFLLSMACFLTSVIFGSISLLKLPSLADIKHFLNSEIT